jgi:hypothetical protein
MMPEIAKASLGFTGTGNEQFGQQINAGRQTQTHHRAS